MFNEARKFPLLQNLSEEELKLLEPLFDIFTCPANHPIFEQNDPTTHLYFLINGIVTLHYKPYDGARMVLTRLHEGDAFGWSAVVGGSVYTSGAYSETDIKALRIRGADLRKLCREHQELGSIILDRLSDSVANRWHDSRQQVQAILSENLKRNGKLNRG